MNTMNTSKTPSPKPLPKQPSPQAVEIAAKIIVAKGIREGKLKPSPPTPKK
jgi:hypothetical protein